MIYNAVLSLDLNRILGRLGSQHYERPVHERGRSQSAPLHTRLSALLGKAKTTWYEPETSTYATLLSEVEELERLFTYLERLDQNDWQPQVRKIVDLAFLMTKDGASLIDSLLKTGAIPYTADRRAVQDLLKVAQYSKVCRGLVTMTRAHRELCSNIQLRILEPFTPHYTGGKSRYVHAEVQIIVDVELHAPKPWPRIIAASKEACFLCNAFIQSHGMFVTDKAHRQVFSQWTVPDLAQYTHETLKRFRKAMKGVHARLDGEIRLAKRRTAFRPYPCQSSANLMSEPSPSLSVTTVSAVSCTKSTTTLLERGSPSCSSPQPNSASRQELRLCGAEEVENADLINRSTFQRPQRPEHNLGTAHGSSSLAPTEPSSSVSDESISQRASKLLLSVPTFVATSWLHLHLIGENRTGSKKTEGISEVQSPEVWTEAIWTAQCQEVDPIRILSTDQENITHVPLESLAVGEEITLPNYRVSEEANGHRKTGVDILFTKGVDHGLLLQCR